MNDITISEQVWSSKISEQIWFYQIKTSTGNKIAGPASLEWSRNFYLTDNKAVINLGCLPY